MKQISILLTKYSDWISNLVYHIAGRGYTHASIGLGEAVTEYYSFNYKGFAVETIENHKRRGVRRSYCYQVRVSDEAYARIEAEIKVFQQNKEQYRYSRLGVLCCILHLPFRRKNYYFCSQFVAELLKKTEAIDVKRNPCFFLPNHFIPLLEKHPDCISAIPNAV